MSARPPKTVIPPALFTLFALFTLSFEGSFEGSLEGSVPERALTVCSYPQKIVIPPALFTLSLEGSAAEGTLRVRSCAP